MGVLDKIKGLAKSHKSEVSSGIDEVAGLAEKELGHKKEVEQAADTVKEQLGVEQQPKPSSARARKSR